MALRALPSTDLLLQLFRYDADSGRLVWNFRPLGHFSDARSHKIWNTRYPHKRAGYSDGKGHRMVRIDRIAYFEHRVIWAIHYGSCTSTDVDHQDGDGENNRIENLRAVTHSENARNMKTPSNNKSGHIGVRWDRRRSRWVVEIGARTTRRRLGSYVCLTEAVTVRRKAELDNGYHPNHGRVAKA